MTNSIESTKSYTSSPTFTLGRIFFTKIAFRFQLLSRLLLSKKKLPISAIILIRLNSETAWVFRTIYLMDLLYNFIPTSWMQKLKTRNK